MDSLLRLLLTEAPTPEPLGSVEDWWTRHVRLTSRFALPVDVAFAGGFHADRLGYAFASGYQAALYSLVPSLPRERRHALCATESGGGHPSAMKTRLTGAEGGTRTLEGTKTFVSLGTSADELLVVASEGQDAQGRNRLRLVRLDARRPGVTLTALPPPRFMPEIPHAELRLDAVAIAPEAVLPGDGYARYLKPFRTVEDCHVFASVLGWLLQVARRSDWPEQARESLLALGVMMRGLASAEPSSPTVHLALSGAIELVRERLERFEPLWAQVDAPTRERWERDRPLLHIAGKVRALRREAALRVLSKRGGERDSDETGSL